MRRNPIGRGLCAAFGVLMLLIVPAAAQAQAWVPARGTGTLSLTYQHTEVKNHLFSADMTPFGGDGPRLDLGHIQAQTANLTADYGVIQNLAVNASIAYVAAVYHGIAPESVLDDGKMHGTLQDVSLGVRYLIPWNGIAITPDIGFAFPTHAYPHHGHTAVGRDNQQLTAGLSLGRSLAPWAPSGFVQTSYSHEFVKNVQQWGLDSNTYGAGVGYFILPQLSVGGYFSYLAVTDGIDWYWADFSAPGVGHNHDRAAKTLARRAGGSLNYQFGASNGVFVDVGGMLSGANTHDGLSYSVGTNWNFTTPFVR